MESAPTKSLNHVTLDTRRECFFVKLKLTITAAAITLLTILITLSACATDQPATITGVPQSRSVNRTAAAGPHYAAPEDENQPTPISVLHYAHNAIRGVFEPGEGIYLGAWLMPGYEQRDFTRRAGQSHAVFVHEITICEEVPVTWLLQCMADRATPLFVLHPPTDCETPVGDMLAALAQRLGMFNLPMFIAFYPPGHGLVPAEYSVVFRYARAVFLRYAPQAAFVWVAPNVMSTIRNPFFPGSDAVDWVAVALLDNRDASGHLPDTFETFAPFYHMFEPHHPIMILPLGVSHFSGLGHSYHLSCAGLEIQRVYRTLQGFPRVGLVVYGDVFGFVRNVRDDFAITVEPQLMLAYSKAIAHPHFLPELERSAQPGRWVRSPHMGYSLNGEFYVDLQTLEDLSLPLPQSVEINGREFANIKNIANISFCHVRGVVLITGM